MTDIAYNQPRGRSTTYLAVWALLAFLALGYLALLALRPDLASQLILGPAESAPESNHGQRAMTRALAELSDVKKTLARVEGELMEVRQQMGAEAKRAADFEARITALESGRARRAEAAPVAAAAPISTFETVVSSAPDTPRGLAGRTVEGTVNEAAGEPPLPVAKLASAALMKAAEPKEKAPPVGILVGTGPSVDAIRLSWQLIVDGNARLMKSLEPRYVESPTEPGVFQLIAGPVATKEEAQRVCQRLKAKQVRCSVNSTFAGEPL